MINNIKKVYKKIKKKKKRTHDITTSLKAAFNDQYIIAYWSDNKNAKNNWGDAINPVLINKLSGKIAIHIKDVYNISNKPVYTIVGSILEHPISENLVIWGAGFMYKQSRLNVKNVKAFAVRGPLTRKNLMKSGVDCPKVYGDPALLWPMFYKGKAKVKYQLGVIPHYEDFHNPSLKRFKDDENVLIIDIKGGIKTVVDQILSCECIASSSLHGLIVADAYSVPSVWIKFSDKVLGGDFKFQDYFLSVGREEDRPVFMNDSMDRKYLLQKRRDYRINFDKNKLLEACPIFK